MKKLLIILGAVVILGVVGFYALNSYIYNEKQGQVADSSELSELVVTPIAHATMVLSWNSKVIYTDPTGGAEAFAGQPQPDFILITDIHGDHLNVETLAAVVTDQTKIFVPQAVFDLLLPRLQAQAIVMGNGQIINEGLFYIQAIPMYNLPDGPDARHTKGRGNGYVIESTGERVYVAGDTAGIPEMRALQDINVAFVPMNLPFTMGVEEAADAVLEFKPKKVYPFHYRGQEGLADTGKFKELVNAGDPNIEVVLLNWYPEAN